MATNVADDILDAVAACIVASTATTDGERRATAFAENVTVMGTNTPGDRTFDIEVRGLARTELTGHVSATEQVGRRLAFTVVLHYQNPADTLRGFSTILVRDAAALHDRIPKALQDAGIGDGTFPDQPADFSPVEFSTASLAWESRIYFVVDYREDLTQS